MSKWEGFDPGRHIERTPVEDWDPEYLGIMARHYKLAWTFAEAASTAQDYGRWSYIMGLRANELARQMNRRFDAAPMPLPVSEAQLLERAMLAGLTPESLPHADARRE